MNGKYKIEAYSYLIGNPERTLTIPASHNFWIVRNPENEVIAELHGLATDRVTGDILPVGYNKNHSLNAYIFSTNGNELSSALENDDVAYRNEKYMEYYTPISVGVTVFEGSKEEVFERVVSAAKAIPEINQQDLDYPFMGVGTNLQPTNSNSMFRTFGEIMKLPAVNFPGVSEPGIGRKTLSDEGIAHYQGNYEQIDKLTCPFNKNGEPLFKFREPAIDASISDKQNYDAWNNKFQKQMEACSDPITDASKISSVTGSETVDFLLANLENPINNPNGFDLEVMLATLETKEGKEFLATVDKGVEELKIAEASIENDIQSPDKSKGMSIA